MRTLLEGIAFYLHNISIQYSIHLNFINISNRKANLRADRKYVKKYDISYETPRNDKEQTVNRRELVQDLLFLHRLWNEPPKAKHIQSLIDKRKQQVVTDVAFACWFAGNNSRDL